MIKLINKFIMALATIIIFCMVSVVCGEPIFNNLGLGDTWITSYSNKINNQYKRANRFITPDFLCFLDSVEIALRAGNATSVNVSLMTSTGTKPDMVLETTSIVNIGHQAIYTANFTGTTILEPNTQYWVVLWREDCTFLRGYSNNTSDMGMTYTSAIGGPWIYSSLHATCAMRVNAIPMYVDPPIVEIASPPDGVVIGETE